VCHGGLELDLPLGYSQLPLGQLAYGGLELDLPLGQLYLPLGQLIYGGLELDLPLGQLYLPLGQSREQLLQFGVDRQKFTSSSQSI